MIKIRHLIQSNKKFYVIIWYGDMIKISLKLICEKKYVQMENWEVEE